MKKMLLVIFVIFLINGCKANDSSNASLMKYGEYKNILIDDVSLLEIVDYTENGKEESIIDNHDDIVKKYNYLNSLMIGNETKKTCSDNTSIYKFKQNNQIISIEIECGDVLIIDNTRLELIK